MHKLISDIKIGSRARRDLGDLTSLAESIDRRGLINPITIDRDGNLIAGHRRLEALRSLGRLAADVRIVDTMADTVQALEMERDENTQRLAMTDRELSDLAAAIAAMKREAAAARQSHGVTAPGRGVNALVAGDQSVKVDAQVARALGMGATRAKELISIGRAAASQDEMEAAAGRRAQERLDRGESSKRASAAMREELGRVRAGTPTVSQRSESAERGRQDRLWRGLADQARGLADAIPQLRNGGMPQKPEEAASWARDLRKLRTVISQTIDFLEGKE